MRTALEEAPSWAKHFVSQMAACRQSSRCSAQLETLGMETNFDSAYMRVSSVLAMSIHLPDELTSHTTTGIVAIRVRDPTRSIISGIDGRRVDFPDLKAKE